MSRFYVISWLSVFELQVFILMIWWLELYNVEKQQWKINECTTIVCFCEKFYEIIIYQKYFNFLFLCHIFNNTIELNEIVEMNLIEGAFWNVIRNVEQFMSNQYFRYILKTRALWLYEIKQFYKKTFLFHYSSRLASKLILWSRSNFDNDVTL